MNKKEIKKQEHISMERFLRQHLNIQNERVIEILKDLSHQEFKDLYEELYSLKLRCLPFEVVSKEDVQMGEVLLVLDKYNNTAPYVNPIQITFDDIIETERKRNIERQIQPETLEEYVDTLDSAVFDESISKGKIKTYSKSRTITRKDDSND